ncbi:hypothetical protein BDN72DRAFT_837540 [Pluteus cervinus]|uniref:Uncharacterized protein n=1 Tax=Pluteus cervinus TaxID=181527 RepID=A0ACD3B0D7_9AGAR|nr:hypothetical protein BDN72DRAFT_837540 [Pluteus cervinus]
MRRFGQEAIVGYVGYARAVSRDCILLSFAAIALLALVLSRFALKSQLFACSNSNSEAGRL